ncbi:MAG: arginine--tRNA ligase [Candidatus Brocadiia bacterium]
MGICAVLEDELLKGFRAALADAVGEADVGGLDVQFAPTPSFEVGELGFGCFPLAKVLRRSPNDIAARLAERIELPPPLRGARAVGPYLNLFVDRSAFLRRLCSEIAEAGQAYGSTREGQGLRVALEFSSPNTNKPQHLGHIRNNLVGMCLARLLEAAGHDVVKVNLVNDRGVHICKSMLAYQRWGQGETPQSAGRKGDHLVGDYYVRFAQAADRDPSLNAQAQRLLQRWEDGEPQTVELWKTMNRWVYEGFQETYRRLGVSFDHVYYESETYRHGREIVLRALDAGLCRRLPDGAVEVDLSDEGLDRKILLRRDGTSVYMTQDLGTAVRRVEELAPDALYYVVGSEQIYHFRVLFALLRRLGYAWADRCRHISYGMVYLPEGKMKSREGKVVDADDLLDEVERLSAQAVAEKHPDISGPELERRQRQIALGAIAFYLLNVNLEKDISFDPAASVSFEGDTGPYIQYAHTRICGILRKASQRETGPPEFAQLGNDDEMALGLGLLRFPAAVRDAARTTNPARLAGHVLELARTFAQFYHQNPVLQAGTPGLVAARLELCRAVRAVLQRGLNLLGIEAPERM